MKKQTIRQVSLPTEAEVEKERKRLAYRKEYRRTIQSTFSALVVVAAIAVLLSTLLLSLLQVSGSSMEPTLQDKDIVVLVKSSHPKRNDLYGFYWNNKILLKRIVGLPDDIIEIDEEGNLYVNGELIDEPFIKESGATGNCDIEFPYRVPQEHYFALGDNREDSIDSRMSVIGSISEEQMMGRVTVRIWPLDRMSFVR